MRAVKRPLGKRNWWEGRGKQEDMNKGYNVIYECGMRKPMFYVIKN